MLDKIYNDTNYTINKCSFCPYSLLNEIGRLTCQSSSCLLTGIQLENMMKVIFGGKNEANKLRKREATKENIISTKESLEDIIPFNCENCNSCCDGCDLYESALGDER